MKKKNIKYITCRYYNKDLICAESSRKSPCCAKCKHVIDCILKYEHDRRQLPCPIDQHPIKEYLCGRISYKIPRNKFDLLLFVHNLEIRVLTKKRKSIKDVKEEGMY